MVGRLLLPSPHAIKPRVWNIENVASRMLRPPVQAPNDGNLSRQIERDEMRLD
jgi:hypothetical protein